MKIIRTTSNEMPMDLLLLADPSSSSISEYLHQGNCYIVKEGSKVCGGIVLFPHSASEWEIKNIAVYEDYQRKGIARNLLESAIDIARSNQVQRITIATGNSSLHQLKLYQQVGFEMERIVDNHFTEHYSEPIFEYGIQCKHLIILCLRM